MFKRLIYLLLLAVILCATCYAYLLWQNNRNIDPPTSPEIQNSLAASITWLEQHEQEILNQNNPVLWWMIKQSADLTGDIRLRALFYKYQAKYLDHMRDSVWALLFLENTWIPLRHADISNLPDYNKHFFYALTCDKELGRHPAISAQNEVEYCDTYLFRPACVTHQLIAFRIMQRKSCGDQKQLAKSVEILQRRVERQLTWDPRVLDVYLQRVLMLAETDAKDLIKPIWLRRILVRQGESGGWGGFEPLVPLVGGQSFGFSNRGFSIRRPKESFHATAQGVFIMSLMSTKSGGE